MPPSAIINAPQMSSTKQSVSLTLLGIDYAFDGQVKTIGGFARDNPVGIQTSIRDQPLAAYLEAQMLFWGLAEPYKRIGVRISKTISELEEFSDEAMYMPEPLEVCILHTLYRQCVVSLHRS
jgi:hypothetical protein